MTNGTWTFSHDHQSMEYLKSVVSTSAAHSRFVYRRSAVYRQIVDWRDHRKNRPLQP
jgi:hypothetical protein